MASDCAPSGFTFNDGIKILVFIGKFLELALILMFYYKAISINYCGHDTLKKQYRYRKRNFITITNSPPIGKISPQHSPITHFEFWESSERVPITFPELPHYSN